MAFGIYLIVGLLYFMYVAWLVGKDELKNYQAYLAWILSFPYLLCLCLLVLFIKSWEHLNKLR